MGEGPYCIGSDGDLCGPGLQPLPFKVWYTPRNLETLGDIAFAQGAAIERKRALREILDWASENLTVFYTEDEKNPYPHIVAKRLYEKINELSGVVKDAGERLEK